MPYLNWKTDYIQRKVFHENLDICEAWVKYCNEEHKEVVHWKTDN